MQKSIRLSQPEDTETSAKDYLLRGRSTILKLQQALAAFCERCGQDGRISDLPYFFGKRGVMDGEAILFLRAKRALTDDAPLQGDDILGAVLMYEYRLLGVPLRAMAVIDRTGGAILAPLHERAALTADVRDYLIRTGVHLAILSVDGNEAPDFAAQLSRRADGNGRHLWKTRHRRYPAFLKLEATLDATLATINQKTRSNLRYYRRRAEKEFHCVFMPEITVSFEELEEFNRISSHPVSDAVLRWRLRGQSLLRHPVLAGVKDDQGKWLSILAARRDGDRSEILWQMNRGGLPQHSIGTVMRSYFIEHEVGRGMKRMCAEQGTPHLMKHSFVHRDLHDTVILRKSFRRVLEKLTDKYLPADNPLSELLHSTQDHWNVAGE